MKNDKGLGRKALGASPFEPQPSMSRRILKSCLFTYHLQHSGMIYSGADKDRRADDIYRGHRDGAPPADNAGPKVKAT